MKNVRVEGLETATNPSISRNQLFTTSLQGTRCSCQPSRDGRRLDKRADSRCIQQATSGALHAELQSQRATIDEGKPLY